MNSFFLLSHKPVVRVFCGVFATVYVGLLLLTGVAGCYVLECFRCSPFAADTQVLQCFLCSPFAADTQVLQCFLYLQYLQRYHHTIFTQHHGELSFIARICYMVKHQSCQNSAYMPCYKHWLRYSIILYTFGNLRK